MALLSRTFARRSPPGWYLVDSRTKSPSGILQRFRVLECWLTVSSHLHFFSFSGPAIDHVLIWQKVWCFELPHYVCDQMVKWGHIWRNGCDAAKLRKRTIWATPIHFTTIKVDNILYMNQKTPENCQMMQLLLLWFVVCFGAALAPSRV